MDEARSSLDHAGFSRNPYVPAIRRCCRDGHAPRISRPISKFGRSARTTLRQAAKHWVQTLWPQYLTSAGKDGFFHYVAFDGSRPVAIAALCVFEDVGYLMAAATAERDRKRGAQQARSQSGGTGRTTRLRAARSETLSMLEHSYRNLQRAGFEEVYDKDVYEWNARS